MSLVYTDHATLRMKKRQLQRAWVERVVANPMRIDPDNYDDTLEHRLATVPELANRVLRVIVSKNEPKRVVSVYLDGKLKGKL